MVVRYVAVCVLQVLLSVLCGYFGLSRKLLAVASEWCLTRTNSYDSGDKMEAWDWLFTMIEAYHLHQFCKNLWDVIIYYLCHMSFSFQKLALPLHIAGAPCLADLDSCDSNFDCATGTNCCYDSCDWCWMSPDGYWQVIQRLTNIYQENKRLEDIGICS